MRLTVSGFNSTFEEWEDTKEAEPADVVGWLLEHGAEKVGVWHPVGWGDNSVVQADLEPGTYIVWRVPDGSEEAQEEQ